MIAAFFHDERFVRDASGTYYGSAAVPYRSLARYLKYFDRVVVVARIGEPKQGARTIASGEGVEWACVTAAAESSLSGFLVAARRRVREVLERVDCAVIRMPSLVGTIACHEALAREKPWLAEVVGDGLHSLWSHGTLKAKLAALPMDLLFRHYLRRSRFSIYVTKSALQRRYPPRGRWVAASNTIIDPPCEGVLQRRLDRIDARGGPAFVLGLIGCYDVEYKGHETALRALAHLRRSGRPVTLRCIGVGDPSRWRSRAEALGVVTHVELGGALAQGQPVLEWLDRLDACIVPSLTEGLPRCLVEAMSRALPAIGSSAGGIPELLDPRWLHRPGDHVRLARLVDGLARSPCEMKTQARRNWRVAAEYAVDVIEARRDRFIRDFQAAMLGERTRALA